MTQWIDAFDVDFKTCDQTIEMDNYTFSVNYHSQLITSIK